MVRVFIKGGVWKNSEDEILKAAVMKYGKQQWARVASLLNRKSAKQCKARWNEWLDPMVRKIEWSRAEDEKLLHLAKLLPAQWKTIGPLIGRTATQCQERYERLLDEASGGGAEEGTSQGGGAAGVAVGEGGAVPSDATSIRKLRPGEIDPHPETKPARPDPIDMDEDEIEMLQEARARLANTQGKKAKRKQREKMLAEAKRLADLQKRRELKQAGLLSSHAKTRLKKRSREIDLGVEIPFHKPAPAGFHDVNEEKDRSEVAREKRRKDVNYKKINEDQYRSRDRETLTAQKKEQARLRGLERANMQLVVAEVSKKNDPTSARARGVLSMPAPTVSDGELSEVAKLTNLQKKKSGLMSMPTSGGGGAVTDALLSDYSDRPLPTPMRTPAVGGMSSRDVVLREASNLRAIERGETPLLGGENPALQAGGTGTGSSLHAATPQITAASSSSGASIATPMQRSLLNATPMTATTNMTVTKRDELGLNATPKGSIISADDDAVSFMGDASTFGGASTVDSRSMKQIAREERRAAKRARLELEQALAALPAPQFEYELAVPQVTDDNDEESPTDTTRERDAADVDREQIKLLEQEAAKLYEARSAVLKREGELPRPKHIHNLNVDDDGGDDTPLSLAETLLLQEMQTLVNHDAYAHPICEEHNSTTSDSKKKKKKKSKKRKLAENDSSATPTNLDYIPEEQLDTAKALLMDEFDSIFQQARTNFQLQQQPNTTATTTTNVNEELVNHNMQSSQSGVVTDTTTTTKSQRLSQFLNNFTALSDTSQQLRKKADKLQSKLSIQHGGYEKRADTLRNDILQNFAQCQHAKIEQTVYEQLQRQEAEAIHNRVHALEEDVNGLEESERLHQKKYGDLIHERKRLNMIGRG